MKSIVLATIMSYAPAFLFILASACILAFLAVLGFMTPKLLGLLKKLADSFESEKVRTRLHDAIGKLDLVIEDIISSESKLYKDEMQLILADGKVEAEELKALVTKMGKTALDRITPDHNTFKNFLVGECLQDFVLTRVQSRMISWAKEQVEAKMAPSVAPAAKPANPQ